MYGLRCETTVVGSDAPKRISSMEMEDRKAVLQEKSNHFTAQPR